ncbi:hypothetical protein [Roseivirga pacifica]|uniref:hypothetical protein n=1 Tax=Roseivirga pacifica TaxID=1267423 RepID=UPI00227A2D5E|nr:hypothetical protein [Roseivirga pacifica]
MNRRILGALIIVCSIVAFSCQPKSEYQKLVDKELSRNIRLDSLFLGISFDMPKKEFFAHCWELNNQRVLVNGAGELSIKYDPSDYFKHPTNMSFYPKYVNDRIVTMPVEFQYKNWALWNEEASVEVLIEDVQKVFLEWYGGNDFTEIVNKDETLRVWVKVDGNRQIRLYKKNVSTVRVEISDLTELNRLKEQAA